MKIRGQDCSPSKSVGFVIGNGNSRKKVDLHELKDIGFVYGCNALYRDFAPDFLISVDPNMIGEILRSGYAEDHVVLARLDRLAPEDRSLVDGLMVMPFPLEGTDIQYTKTAGEAALAIAAKECNPIFMIGIDFGNQVGQINNVYAGTDNYDKENSKGRDFEFWGSRFVKLVQNFPERRFIWVGDIEDQVVAAAFEGLSNFHRVPSIEVGLERDGL